MCRVERLACERPHSEAWKCGVCRRERPALGCSRGDAEDTFKPGRAALCSTSDMHSRQDVDIHSLIEREREMTDLGVVQVEPLAVLVSERIQVMLC